MASADSASADFEESDVIEIISAEEYDPQRAKLRSSISWILTKAYGVNIPPQIKEPFYENAKGQLQLKPQLVNLLVSSDLYCQACSNMFTDTASQWQGHWSIIQVLSRKGIYVTESAEAVVTETVLMQTAPFKVAAHLALIDALMKAYASEIASVERVVQAVRRYSSFNASSELPCGTEEALMFWVNKTCAALASRGDLESEIIQGESSQKVRIISKSTPREPRSIPKMEELQHDLGDGCCLAAVIAFYQPDSFPLKDVCLKESLGIADSLYNLRLVRTYCERHLVLKCFHFTYEDLLYGRDNLHPNMLVFVAELFFLLEAMQDRGSSGHKEGAVEGAGLVGGRRLPSPSLPQISSATKRSFQKTAAEEGRNQVEKFGTSPSSLSSRQPLLPRRTPGRRSNSLSSPQERDTVRRSVLAWQDDQDLKERKSQASTLLENVSMSWEADTTDPELEAVTSADLADFESAGPHLVDPHHPDYMELVSVTPGSPRSTPRSMLAERLMPATLRPAKEKTNNHSKAEERGDRAVRKKAATSPTTPKASSKGKLSPPGSVVRGRTSPGGGTGSVGSGGGEGGQQRSSGSLSSTDETIVTPLASADLISARTGGESSPVPPSQREVQSGQSVTVTDRVPPSEAFVIQPDAADSPIPLPHSPRRTVSTAGVSGDRPTTSYTLVSTIHDAQSARDAGLPVIGRSASDLPPDVEVGVRLGGVVGVSREGSVASSRSSGDFSDHESHKIHQDHKARESLKHSPRRLGDVGDKMALLQPQVDVTKPGPLIMDQLPDGGKKPGTTSFAELRRLKEGLGNMDNSGYIYMQHGMEPSQGGGSDPQRVGPSGAVVKKAAFGQLPNETTWRQSAQRTAAGAATPTGSSNGGGGGDDSSLSPSQAQFSQLKLKLEEKRREIERNKQRQEMATAKMRQRMGKLAFMRVISKQDDASAGIVNALSTQPALLGSGLVGSGDVSNNSSVSGGLSGTALHDRLDHVSRPTTLSTRSNSSSTSTSASQSPSSAAASNAGRPFSREGIQQTIDGVKRRWFHGSDPEGDLIRATSQVVDEADADGVPVSQLSNDMMQSCPPSMAAAAFGYAPRPGSAVGQEGQRNSPGLLEQSRRLSETDGILGTATTPAMAAAHRQVRELSQSPRPGASPERRSSSFSGEQEEYDQSLDKLNKSLTELQGEIKRLSLQQQEQFRAAVKPTVTGFESQQVLPGHPNLAAAPQPQQFPPQQPPLLPSHPGMRTVVGPVVRTATHSLQPSALSDPFSAPSLVPSAQPSPPPPASLGDLPLASGDGAEGLVSQDDDSSSGNGGFFMVFGEESAPRRPRPKLGKEREVGGGGARRKDSGGEERVPLTLGGGMVQASAWAGSGELSSNHSGSHHSLGSDDSSQAATYVLGPEPGTDGQGSQDTEMQKKKERLIKQQQKRKEEQERKRIEKEMEIQCKLEQKMQKEEEQARKKAEEKARKEAIFQQYLQKKMDGDEDKSPVSNPVARRDRSAHGGQPRPKSMFVKNRPVVVDVLDGAAANHSSQEDLALLKSPPSGAALSPLRLNPNSRGNIRKAVSTSQLTQNGSQGASTYRRPPSPGQGRRPPSPGPKLFVKPSAKSNRHIIINALSYCCLAGIVNNDLKNKVLEEIARSTAKHFLILFRDHGCQYRGLYSFDPDSEEAYKITGVGPRLLASDMVEKFYKYNSGGKSFTEVTSTKHLSVSIDAVVLMNTYWKSKPPSALATTVKK